MIKHIQVDSKIFHLSQGIVLYNDVPDQVLAISMNE